MRPGSEASRQLAGSAGAKPPKSGGPAPLPGTPGSRPHEAEDHVLVAASDALGMLALIRFGSGVYLRLFGSLGLIVLAAGSVMVAARTLGRLVEALVAGDAAAVTRLGASFLALEALAVGLQYFGRVGLASATIEVTYRVRCELFEKMRRLPISYFDFQPLGRTLTRLTHDVEGMETFFNGTMAKCITALITIVAVLVAMLTTDPAFGAVIVASSLPALIFSIAARKPTRDWLRVYKKRSAHLNAKLAEFLNGMAVIRIFGLESWSKKAFDEGAAHMLRAGLNTMNWNSVIRPVTVFLCSLPTLLILWQGGDRVLAGAMQLGTLIAFVRFSERFVGPIRTLSQEVQNIQEALVSSERVRRMLAESEESVALGSDGTETPALTGAVEYRGVEMRYGDGKPVLKGVSFTGAAGMKVGLVGATGSGKTSTVNLLPRLYPFDAGEVLFDGVPVQRIQREHLRRHIGYVTQDVVVFAGTLRENLVSALDLRGGAAVDDRAIRAACAATGLDRALASQDGRGDPLDRVVVDGGDNLSMGERQLIALTRMLLRDPKMLILDEATANVDERCERLVQTAIARVMTGRTCFVIAHRLSTIVQCDLILVFKAGQIVEQGTHAELMRKRGEYYALASQQLVDTD